MSTAEAPTFVQKLKHETTAVRLRLSKFGARKALDPAQRDAAANVFDAEGKSISASKRLLNTKNDAYRGVTGVLSAAKAYWKSVTVPYPEDGIRLIRRSRVDAFETQMAGYVTQLDQALAALADAYVALRDEARDTLGELFNGADYPDTLIAEFALAWEYPSTTAPEYLKTLNPELYEKEQARVQERLNEAMRLTEEAFAAEFSKLVGHLTERLGGSEDGKPKTFTKATVTNLNEFFAKFKEMGAGSSESLDNLIESAQQAIAGVDATALRKDGTLRATVSEKLAEVATALDGMLVNKPKRAISLEDD